MSQREWYNFGLTYILNNQGATNPLARLPGASKNHGRASKCKMHLPVRASGYLHAMRYGNSRVLPCSIPRRSAGSSENIQTGPACIHIMILTSKKMQLSGAVVVARSRQCYARLLYLEPCLCTYKYNTIHGRRARLWKKKINKKYWEIGTLSRWYLFDPVYTNEHTIYGNIRFKNCWPYLDINPMPGFF